MPEISVHKVPRGIERIHFYQLDIRPALATLLRNPTRRKLAFISVTPLGLRQGLTLNKHGLLQFCLLGTDLFNFAHAPTLSTTHIRHPQTGQPHACANRSQLLETLVGALSTYDMYCMLSTVGAPYLLQRQTQQALQHIEAILTSFLALRARGRLPTIPSQRLPNRPTILRAYDTIAKVLTSLPLDHYRIIQQSSSDRLPLYVFPLPPETRSLYNQEDVRRNKLLHEMRIAFKDHGPSKYDQHAILLTLAVFLIRVGLEAGVPQTVAARLTKHWQRHPMPEP